MLFHYVLMTNHVHLVIEPAEDEGGLSEIMKGINLSKDEYLLACGSYVELNPVRAEIVDAPMKCPWSSYRAYA